MKISDYSPVAKPGATTKKKEAAASAGGAGFLGLLSVSEAEAAAANTPVSDVIPPNSMNALLSLQEMPDDEVARRKAAMEEGRGTLEALETLRLGLLTGSVPEHLLQTLSRVVAQQKQRVDDPRLMSLIEDIELRAAVELAKLERARRDGE